MWENFGFHLSRSKSKLKAVTALIKNVGASKIKQATTDNNGGPNNSTNNSFNKNNEGTTTADAKSTDFADKF